VAELFEARKPKEHAVISEIDGVVAFGKDTNGNPKVVITPHIDGKLRPDHAKEYLIGKGKHISVHTGDRVRAGEALMDGAANPHDILRVLGEKELARYLVDEVQEVYRLQGVKINDKHIETARCCGACASSTWATPTSWSTSRSRNGSSTTRTTRW
jgi:DNA-directed RNA polymerase subunit beta'